MSFCRESNVLEQPGSMQQKDVTVSFLARTGGTQRKSSLLQLRTATLGDREIKSGSVTAHSSLVSCFVKEVESRELPSSDKEQSVTRVNSESLTHELVLGSS